MVIKHCELCGRAQVSIEIDADGRNIHVCDECAHRFSVEQSFNKILLELIALTEKRNWAAALSLLRAFWDGYKSQDIDGWLESKVLAHEAAILEEAGSFSQAIAAHRRLQQLRLGGHDVSASSEYLVNQLALAKLLSRLNDFNNAIHELEIALDLPQPVILPNSLDLLAAYAQIRNDVPLRYVDLVRRVIEWWGIDIPVGTHDTRAFASSIIRAAELYREAAIRFRQVTEEIKSSKDPKAVSDILQRYIETEQVRFYRSRAQEILSSYDL